MLQHVHRREDASERPVVVQHHEAVHSFECHQVDRGLHGFVRTDGKHHRHHHFVHSLVPPTQKADLDRVRLAEDARHSPERVANRSAADVVGRQDMHRLAEWLVRRERDDLGLHHVAYGELGIFHLDSCGVHVMDGAESMPGRAKRGTGPALGVGMSRVLIACAFVAACAPFKPLPSAGAAHPPVTTSVDGEIMGVDRMPPQDRLASGVRVTLRTSEKPVVVDLAPAWYLGKNGLTLDKSERMRVEGQSKPGSVVYATSVEQDGKRVQLRDAAGRPLWKEE